MTALGCMLASSESDSGETKAKQLERCMLGDISQMGDGVDVIAVG